VVLAARGARNLDQGEEKISDSATVTELRRQARRVHIQASLTAAALTALLMLMSNRF